MNITRISSISFMGKIIDSHAHIGQHEGHKFTKNNLDIFVKEKLPNNDTVEKVIVSDLDVLNSLKNEYTGNKDLVEKFKNDKNYVLIASCSPKDGSIENIKKLFNENENVFAGLKFHPKFQNLEVTNKEYEPYMIFAEKNNLPCLFHTEVLTDNEGKLLKELSLADPDYIYNLGKKYKNTPIIMAHLGAGWKEAHDKTIDILVESIKKGDANLYADISWVDIDAEPLKDETFGSKEHIIKAIKKLKGIGDSSWSYGDQSFRLMFGTDIPLGRFNNGNENAIKDYTKFIDEIKHAIRNDADLKLDAEKIIDDLFYNNAEKLYIEPLKKKAEQIKQTRSLNINGNKTSVLKILFAACIGLIGFCIGNSIIHKYTNSNSKNYYNN